MQRPCIQLDVLESLLTFSFREQVMREVKLQERERERERKRHDFFHVSLLCKLSITFLAHYFLKLLEVYFDT